MQADHFGPLTSLVFFQGVRPVDLNLEKAADLGKDFLAPVASS
jgi:hypothetical protein